MTVFAHANTGNDLKDHTVHVLWLGPSETLNLAALSGDRTARHPVLVAVRWREVVATVEEEEEG